MGQEVVKVGWRKTGKVSMLLMLGERVVQDSVRASREGHIPVNCQHV